MPRTARSRMQGTSALCIDTLRGYAKRGCVQKCSRPSTPAMLQTLLVRHLWLALIWCAISAALAAVGRAKYRTLRTPGTPSGSGPR